MPRTGNFAQVVNVFLENLHLLSAILFIIFSSVLDFSCKFCLQVTESNNKGGLDCRLRTEDCTNQLALRFTLAYILQNCWFNCSKPGLKVNPD